MKDSVTKVQAEPSLTTIGIVLVLGAIVPMLDTTMTNVGINTILKDLDSTVNVMQWVTTAYVLALGLAVPLAGWLLDQVSGKLLQEIALAIFAGGSLISATANAIPALVTGRIIQGDRRRRHHHRNECPGNAGGPWPKPRQINGCG